MTLEHFCNRRYNRISACNNNFIFQHRCKLVRCSALTDAADSDECPTEVVIPVKFPADRASKHGAGRTSCNVMCGRASLLRCPVMRRAWCGRRFNYRLIGYKLPAPHATLMALRGRAVSASGQVSHSSGDAPNRMFHFGFNYF